MLTGAALRYVERSLTPVATQVQRRAAVNGRQAEDVLVRVEPAVTAAGGEALPTTRGRAGA